MANDHTLNELVELERAAGAGDKEAQKKLDTLARDEGYQDYDSLTKDISKEFLETFAPVLDKAREVVDQEQKRRESTPDVKYVFERLVKMQKSANPIDRAIVNGVPYRHIYDMAKALNKELMSELATADLGTAEPESKVLPRIPKPGKRLNDWKAAWRKVKGGWHGGNNYRQLAKIANVSEETIADIVKAGDAGLLD
jgi:hypothetical protein